MAAKASRLSIQELESRCTPSTFRWNPDVGNSAWSVLANWDTVTEKGNWVDAISLPGTGGADRVEFGFNDANCIVDKAVYLHRVTILPGYTSELVLEKPLSIQGGDESSVFAMSSTSASVRGFESGKAAAHGTLNMNGDSTFGWSSGNIANITVNVTRGVDTFAKFNVYSAGARTMSGSVLSIDGKLDWDSGDVTVIDPTATSIVAVNPGGEFLVGENAGKWGVETGKAPAGFRVENYGKVTVNSGVPQIKGDYTTVGTTRLEVGILDITGTAEQGGAGVFELRDNTTVNVSGKGEVLKISNGTITGQGTVDGNLVLGVDGDPPPAAPAIIKPGMDGKPGTITVTQSFHIFSPVARTIIVIDANGDHSKIAVGGYAVFNGSLEVEKHADYKPPKPTELKIITYAETMASDFSSKMITNNDGWQLEGTPPGKFWYFKSEKRATEYVLYVDEKGGL